MSDYLFMPLAVEGHHSYLVACTVSGECLVIDPPAPADEVAGMIAERGLALRYVVLTHGHQRHAAGAGPLKERLADARLAAHPADGVLKAGDRELQHGDTLVLGRLRVNVIGTPGESPGGISLFLPFGPGSAGAVVTGDALLAGRLGRAADAASRRLLLDSVRRRLLPLGDGVRVYPGHGPASTLGIERYCNPDIE